MGTFKHEGTGSSSHQDSSSSDHKYILYNSGGDISVSKTKRCTDQETETEYKNVLPFIYSMLVHIPCDHLGMFFITVIIIDFSFFVSKTSYSFNLCLPPKVVFLLPRSLKATEGPTKYSTKMPIYNPFSNK